MSDTVFSGWNTMLSVYAVATFICIVPYQAVGLPVLSFAIEKWILVSLLVAFSAFHLHYGYGIVTEMCEHFGIKCFTVSLSFYRRLMLLSLNGVSASIAD
jgi:ethanolaminephosphotransferase